MLADVSQFINPMHYLIYRERERERVLYNGHKLLFKLRLEFSPVRKSDLGVLRIIILQKNENVEPFSNILWPFHIRDMFLIIIGIVFVKDLVVVVFFLGV